MLFSRIRQSYPLTALQLGLSFDKDDLTMSGSRFSSKDLVKCSAGKGSRAQSNYYSKYFVTCLH